MSDSEIKEICLFDNVDEDDEEDCQDAMELCALGMENGRIVITEGDYVLADRSHPELVSIYATDAATIRAVRSYLSPYFDFSGSGSEVKNVVPCILRLTPYHFVMEQKGKVKLS